MTKLVPFLLHTLLVWVVACLPGVHSSIGLSHRFVDILNGHPVDPLNDNDNDNDVQSLSLEQRLDHFEPSPHKFRQRYFYSDRFVDATVHQQYAFLCMGGEGPSLTTAVLVDSVHCTGDMLELAQSLHLEKGLSVHLFALEHRYYGRSYPTFVGENNLDVSPVTNENLVHLSSRQALGDLAHFVQQMMVQGPTKPLPTNTKWVTFGGSYPGMLAGWARLKYPHIIHAAVSNSAPTNSKLDMKEYNNRVAWDLQYPIVGGSKDCLEIIQEGHAQLAELASIQPGRQMLAEAFQFCNKSTLEHLDNVKMWLGDGIITVPAQGNDPSCDENPLCNIEKLCTSITTAHHDNSSKPSWQILKDLSQEQSGNNNCLQVDWNQTLDYIRDPQKGQMGGLRSWYWQTCTEFGFFQTCQEGSQCPYAKGYHTLDADLQVCEYAFGIDAAEVKESILQTHEYYGDNLLEGGSRILSVNGDVDPWATLARNNDTPNSNDPMLPTFMVEGASHHFWTHAVKNSDSPFVSKARALIYETVTQWLELDDAKDKTLITAV